jgi:hypothetical protein
MRGRGNSFGLRVIDASQEAGASSTTICSYRTARFGRSSAASSTIRPGPEPSQAPSPRSQPTQLYLGLVIFYFFGSTSRTPTPNAERQARCRLLAHGVGWLDGGSRQPSVSIGVQIARRITARDPIGRSNQGKSGYAMLLTQALWSCDGDVGRSCAPRLPGTGRGAT